MIDCTEWQPYFAWRPVIVDVYSVSEIKNGKMSYPKVGRVERRLCVWIDVGDENQVEHRIWRFRIVSRGNK